MGQNRVSHKHNMPALTPETTPMYVNIQYTWSVWVVLLQVMGHEPLEDDQRAFGLAGLTQRGEADPHRTTSRHIEESANPRIRGPPGLRGSDPPSHLTWSKPCENM